MARYERTAEDRSRDYLEHRIRADVLEQETVDPLRVAGTPTERGPEGQGNPGAVDEQED